MNRDYYKLPKSSATMRFLWRCAGGDRYLLERATYSDQIKYMCLGGIVFATGAMAGLAGGYAFYTIFSPKAADVLDKTKTYLENQTYIPTDIPTMISAIIFGIAWGLMIFNIDRFIVTSTGKGDGTEAITKEEFKSAIPRIIMGAIIALTISKPVEIRMFKTEIDLSIKKQQDVEKQKGIEQATVNYEKKVAEAKGKLIVIDQEIESYQKSVDELRTQVSNEITGKNNNGAAYGPRAKELERQATIYEDKIEVLMKSNLYMETDSAIKVLQKQKAIDIGDAEKKAATLDGLLIRIQKAHEIAGFWISLFITMLFMAIELTPVFFKLMLIKTPYDYLAENRDDLLRAENGIEVRYDYYKDKDGQERHLVINHEANRIIFEKIKVTEIQNELTLYAIEKYKKREKGKIDKNLDDYIKSIKPDEQAPKQF
jgi:TolA-binding protein